MAIAGPAISTLAQQFIDAFNQRDPDGLVCLVDPAFEWRPSVLVGRHRTYRGHDGLRQWISDLGHAKVQHQARVREVELLDEKRFLVHSEVLVDGEPMTRSAMLARLGNDGKIVEAQAYLSDEPMLRGTGSSHSVGTVRVREENDEDFVQAVDRHVTGQHEDGTSSSLGHGDWTLRNGEGVNY